MTSRRRGAEDSRSRLLEAAQRLFAENGYEQTTVREIGLSADVDPALIARYFGSKAALYVESLRPDSSTTTFEPIDLTDADAIQGMLERLASKRPTPALHAAIRPHQDADLQRVAMKILKTRFLTPTVKQAERADHDNAQLRAEIAVAALAGIVTSRSSNAFPKLAKASPAEVGHLIAGLIEGLVT